MLYYLYAIFFFQAEDGIRDLTVTGVQTCALPICERIAEAKVKTSGLAQLAAQSDPEQRRLLLARLYAERIGRASCRESVDLGGRRIIKKKKEKKRKIWKRARNE